MDVKNQRTIGPAIPAGLSLLVGGTRDQVVLGLNDISPDLCPPIQATSQCFHLMVGIGFALIGLSLWGAWLGWRGHFEHFVKLGKDSY